MRKGDNYQDEVGFCKEATVEEIANYNYVLSPSRYVGVIEDDSDESFEETMTKLSQDMFSLFDRSHELETRIEKNLKALGFSR